jgi:hypothetical protein
MRVLLVKDDSRIARFVAKGLREYRFAGARLCPQRAGRKPGVAWALGARRGRLTTVRHKMETHKTQKR